MTLTLVESPEAGDRPVSDMTINELVTMIRFHHEASIVGARSTLLHASRVGVALIEVRNRPEMAGQWTAWASGVLPFGKVLPFSKATAIRYMRIATYFDHLPADVGIHDAGLLLAGMPNIRKTGDAWLADEVRRLQKAGLRQVEISESLGISKQRVSDYCNPARARANSRIKGRRRRAASQALVEKARADEERRINAVAKQHGGDISVAHSHVRNLLSYLDKSLAQIPREQHPEIRAAIAAAHKAEDFILAAMKIERQSA
jgi:hypothetical protein